MFRKIRNEKDSDLWSSSMIVGIVKLGDYIRLDPQIRSLYKMMVEKFSLNATE
jgi:hypothetical protein